MLWLILELSCSSRLESHIPSPLKSSVLAVRSRADCCLLGGAGVAPVLALAEPLASNPAFKPPGLAKPILLPGGFKPPLGGGIELILERVVLLFVGF